MTTRDYLSKEGLELISQINSCAMTRAEHFKDSDIVFMHHDLWQKISRSSIIVTAVGDLHVKPTRDIGHDVFHVTSEEEQKIIKEIEDILLS